MRAFLDTVAASVIDRDVTVPMGKILYRAQQGVRTVELEDEDGHTIVETVAFCAERMKPRTDRASEGRANAAGIPVLYLAGARETAIAEVRPWLGAEVSVAQFRVLRDLRVVDLTRGHGQSSVKKMIMERPVGAGEPTLKEKADAVWTDIDAAFSRPVIRHEDAAEYVPTQVLAELFQRLEYDGLIYRSNFGESGYNIAVFDMEAAKAVSAAPFRVTDMSVSANKIGHVWFSRD